MGIRPPPNICIILVFIILLVAKETSQNTRNKRQIQPEQPRILTQNGHLLFQSGTNHNITFRATAGGYINVNGDNLAIITQTVKDNKLAIDDLRTSPSASTDVESRLTQIEGRLNNLQPSGQVQLELTTLGHRIDLLQATVPQNVNSRLSAVESSLNNLEPTGQVQTSLTQLTNRLTLAERRVTTLENTGDENLQYVQQRVRTLQRNTIPRRLFRRTRNKVNQLETTVQNLQTLLTTNECDSSPCRNGGTCVDTFNGFFCRCPVSFQGPICGDDVNECAVYAGTDLGCQNGATCTNTVGSFTCRCTANWHGIRCTESHDDCTGASSTELCGHGTCVNVARVQPGQVKYTCICDDGWTNGGSDPACIADLNECTASRPPCSQDPPVMCINLPGSFTCAACPPGYSGNGYVCVDVNECEMNNGGCSLAPRVQCTNTDGSRSCGPCPAGFVGNGVTCNWVGVCQNNNGGCHPSAACSENPGFEGVTCTCPSGYVGNGVGPAGCVSQGPITGPCGSNPCTNGAACQNILDTAYRCVCQAGYTGQRCETNIDECQAAPCQNGGTCVDRVNGYMCQCTESFSGTNCDEEQQSCGGSLTGESGTFRYPMIPGTTYPHGASCAWRVTTTYGKILRITFPQFNLESHANCDYDYLQIHDGRSASSQMIGKYCGSATPNNGQPISSTHHQLYFWFRSDASIASDGFTVSWTSAMPVCGGDLSGRDHGEFSSPGYPGNYPHDRDCVWSITVSPGNFIMFTFATLAIETHPNCNYDYLEVHDGGVDSSPILQRYCNTTIPPPLTTTGPSAWVKFHTDASRSDAGFHITYAAVSAGDQCGGTFTSETGIVTSPNFPNPYSHDASCVWVITVAPRDTVTLTFTDMNLEGHAACAFDFVEIRDGVREDSPLLGHFCGNNIPTSLTTSNSSMWIKFRSDSSVATSGFRATWSVACGGTFTSPTGIIHSPYWPQPYPSNRQCEYLISVPPDNRVTLTFNSFDIESSFVGCSFDYLEVRDGGSDTSPLLGTFCGAQVPDAQTSGGNLMYLKFVTDGSVQNLGFQAHYTSEQGGCGGLLTDEAAGFQSPGHPNVYPHGVNCTWYIRAPPGLVIRLTFITFSLEQHTACAFDSVSVYDNSTVVAGSLIGKYCGSTPPPVLTSTNNVLTVQMISDASIAREGFHASYVSLNASHMCGAVLTDPTGMITSPNWPDNYPHQRECVWTITAPQGNQILLNVTDFSLENHYRCQFDFLEIRNGGYPSSPLVGVYCGTTVDRSIVSHSNKMYIKLKTDNSRSAAGFRIMYDATATGCGADLTTPTGSFVSPNYPMPYGHNAECFWTITTSRGSTIQLSLVDIDVEMHGRCAYDYLEVRDTDSSGALLGKFCGSTPPDPVVSASNVVWVKYRTDYSVSGRGFHAFYTSVCNTRLTDFSGVIESPNFPDPYPHNRNCTWVIEATTGNSLNISFSHLDIESHSSCRFDYIELRDGGDATAPLLGEGKYCGSSLPPPLASTGEHVYIQFFSDSSVAHNGFRLEYITNGCGGYLTSPSGTFTSPNYPNPYPHRRQCEWTIVGGTGQAVQLIIDTFDLESHSSCLWDVLEVYGGQDDTAPRLAQLCHTQTIPQTLTSTGNTMFVRFKSDSSVSGNGFSATYKMATGGCGGNYTTPSGTIVSKNYPNNYPHNTDCMWLITVNESRIVVLTFTDFDVEGNSNSDCNYDYVAIYDGSDNTRSPEIIKHCGNGLPTPSMYRSHSNKMFIHMRTDNSISAKGFSASYITGCGGQRNAEIDGAIVSPRYPGNYPRSTNCSWLIQARHASDRVTLIFTHMDLESSNDCRHDYVQVLDGNDEGGAMIGTYCGTVNPSPITSQGSALFVTFISDTSIQASGFRATYSQSASACGGTFTSESGSFMSPGYPNSYPLNVECVWTVSVPPGNRVQISFSFFNLEDHTYCNYDYVELHEGQLGGPMIGRFCGATIPSNLTSYDGVWMKFRSDNASTGQGFVAQYSTTYGGDLSGTSGQVASPRYPGQYPHNVNYVWTITVAIGSRIQIVFNTMDMETASDGCIFDYLSFRDGGQADSPLLSSYCGVALPEMFISATNQLYVQFHSDWSSSGQGFLFSWALTSDHPITTPAPTAGTTPVPGCGGFLNATEAIQTLVSPGYPYGYADRLNCTWTMTAQQGFRIWMNITDIDIESHSSCRYDILTIYGYRYPITSLRLGQFCGRTGNSQPLVTRAHQATLVFTTDYSLNRTGFSLQYKTVCGGSIRANTGVLTSPGYPDNYPVSSNCSWRIYTTSGRTIRLQFNPNFNIQGTQESCTGDYLRILNGLMSSSPPLGNTTTDGRHCGTTPPVTMETSSSYLQVDFISDGSGTAPGFSMSFSEVHTTCGGQLELTDMQTSGIFTSPNYPRAYPQSIDCVWIITAPASERIQVDFVDDFSIERHPSCNYDFVELRDGGTINSPQLGVFCGYTRPSTTVSTGNVMYARFRTDTSIPKIGFKAQVKIATCGGRMAGTRGTITSPNYPGNYDNNADCIWVIEAPMGHFLTFTYTDFRLPLSMNCTAADFVEIREINSTGNVIQQACGNQRPAPVVTAGSYGYVRFHSDDRMQSVGFSLNFEASVEACGGDLNTPIGSFQSPNYPGNYPHSRICEWRITVQQGRRITFNFQDFSIEAHSRCIFDYIEVFNGVFSDSPSAGRYCGEQAPTAVVETSGNSARVVFRTDGSVSNGGFQITYSSYNEAACGGNLLANGGNITSPGYVSYGMGNYTNSLQCMWTLTNQRYTASSIVIRFHDFQLESSSSCQLDWLEIREGSSINGMMLGKYCRNTTVPKPIITPMSSIWMRFVTDLTIVDHGFHLTYNFTQCGGLLTNPTGVITSPNYPNNYDHNDACAWKITAPEGQQIVVTFLDFEMEAHDLCVFDYLELFNGPYASSPSMGKYCGTNSPANFSTQSSSIRIVFYTDFSMSARGFKLSYHFSARGCGGVFHNSDGYLATPNYPQSYPHNVECVWDINVPHGYHVDLTFNPPFDLEHSGACDYDYVEVSNGLRNGSLASLGRWCQNILPPPQSSVQQRLVVKFRSDPTTNGNGFAANWTAGCGGILSDRSGSIMSPGFPNEYPDNLRCNYTLDMDPSHYIVLTFDEYRFNIEAGSNCRHDFVAVYQGNSSDGRRLGKFCGTTAPQALSSIGQMYIQFWTDGSIVNQGFYARYRVSECGGAFTEPNGMIQSPTHPVDYHNNMNCTWSITVEPNMIVDVKFSMFDLEAHSICRYDYLDIYDGDSLTSPKIGRYCGNSIPSDLIRSSSNTMMMHFVTDSSVTNAGFRAIYRTSYGESHGCGGILNSTNGGRFGSIDGDRDGQYENNLDCRWLIMVGANKVVKLNILSLDLEANPSCAYDFIKVYDGMSMMDPLVGTYCGSTVPPLFTATSNVLFVQFYSDVSLTGAGFNATYSQQDALCGGTMTASTNPQTVSSPNYPFSASQDVRCRWTIDAPVNQKVEISITAVNLPSTTDCSPEYLQIKDYPMGLQGRNVTVCGSEVPPFFESFGRTVQINYAALVSQAQKGFTLTYKIANCSRTYSGYSGQIYSPGWPGRYPQNAHCEMQVQAPAGTTISLYFNYFHIESHATCVYDYLEIRNGSATSPLISRLCSWVLPDPVFATTNTVSMMFVTDTSITHRGYHISYTATSQGVGCGGNMTGINGSLTSPGYPGNYTLASTCRWLISVPAQRVITLTFTDMRMFDPVDCGTDYVMLYNGNSDRAPQFGRFCSSEIPAPFTTSGNTAFVKFVSNGVGTSLGFRLTYTS